ncbi:MAG TPA: ABC transporter substrate-binding protein [Streptosporangiaceae bacterium]|nr:ABC transporter substrate-binding protein [Streptosporangiaceae bacterium]
MSHRFIKGRFLKGAAAAAVIAMGVAACSSGGTSNSNSKGHTNASGTKPVTLTEESNTGVTFTQNFNPLDSNAMGGQMNLRSLTYEPLMLFDSIKPGTIYPMLAKSYAWSNGGRTLTFTLRQGVKWSDGQPFTSADVAFTFNLINKIPAANTGGVPPITSVSAPNPSTAVLNFKTAQYSNLVPIAGETYIVPKHIWKSISNPATATIKAPVGTGPYTLKSFTSQLITFQANPHYWGGTPPVSQVDIPAYTGNQAATTALSAGQLDWAGNEIPSLKQLYVSKDPAHNHYWFPPGNTVTLWINTARGGPLADAKVRQAISAAINRQQISQKGEYGYEAPATSSSGLILPVQQKYLLPSLANDLPPTAQPSKVTSILSSDGYAKDSKGFWAKNGQEISFSIEDPTAYTDYYADAQLLSSQLKAVGINATVDGVAAPKWTTDALDGNFQTMVHWGGGVGGSNDPYPFGQYQYWMDYTLSAPLGQSAPSDYGRYHNPQAQAAMTAYENTNNPAAQQKALNTLESIESSQMPVIPLVYGADWNEYSTAKFTGWPSPSNPYMDPAPDDPGVGYILMHLKPVS